MDQEVFSMDKMLTVSELSKVTEIPESTVRRYLNKFEAYFRYDSRGKAKKYHIDSAEILKRVAALYNDGYQAHEIESILATQFPFTVSDSQGTTTQPQHKSIEQQFEEFKAQQEEFNRKLFEQLHQQQEYIKELLE
ncbi:MerR family transcriptional regulator, partial [Cellulomonas biazotea]|uniref:MerR family transcriptional regulator n=1 Tax=Cellulomonas biazotea TaxID=1709 RepID=UPI0035EB9CE6